MENDKEMKYIFKGLVALMVLVVFAFAPVSAYVHQTAGASVFLGAHNVQLAGNQNLGGTILQKIDQTASDKVVLGAWNKQEATNYNDGKVVTLVQTAGTSVVFGATNDQEAHNANKGSLAKVTQTA